MAQIVNMTPHAVDVVNEKGELIHSFPASGNQIRLKVQTVSAGELNGIPVSKTQFGEPEGLPEFKEDTFYIVSQLVMNALPHRSDLLVPAEVVRDEKGNILGCKSLGMQNSAIIKVKYSAEWLFGETLLFNTEEECIAEVNLAYDQADMAANSFYDRNYKIKKHYLTF